MLGTSGDGRYRVLDEEATARALLHYGWPYEMAAGGDRAEAAAGKAAEAIGRWSIGDLAARVEGGRRYFDFCEVLNVMVREGLAGDPAYGNGPVDTFRRAARELSEASGEVFEVRLSREFAIPEDAAGRPARLRIPLPLDLEVGGGSVELIEPDPEAAEVVRGANRLEVRLPSASGRVEVAAVVRFVPEASEVRVDPKALEDWDRGSPDHELYTRRSEGIIRVTGAVERLAESLASRSGASHPWEAIRSFWRFFFERMTLGAIHHDEIDDRDPLGWLIELGWFDCYTGSALLVGLCRARGIPARLVNGFTLYSAIPSNHYWAEVRLPPYGWIPLDLASWALAGGDAGREEWGDWYLGRIDARMTYQRLPREIVGPTGVRFPASWYALPSVCEGGMETAYHRLEGGRLLYRDRLQVRHGAAASG